jgi:hypothetical protein
MTRFYITPQLLAALKKESAARKKRKVLRRENDIAAVNNAYNVIKQRLNNN